MEVEARAPGKVILAGEHSVVHGYAAVAASLGLYTRCNIKQTQDDQISLNLQEPKLDLKWSLKDIEGLKNLVTSDVTVADSTSDNIMSELKRLVEDKPFPEANIGIASGVMAFLFLHSSILGSMPCSVVINSELPIGSGLGSSASLCVSVAAALLGMADKISSKNEVSRDTQSSSNGEMKVDETQLHLINKWAFEGEKIIHGRPSGLDNTVSTFGYILRVKNKQQSRLQDSIPLKILLTNTKVGRNTKALVAGVGERAGRHSKALTAIFEATEAVVEEMVDILQSVDLWETSRSEQEAKLEELVEINQGLLQAMGVSHSSIETVCKTTAKYQLRSKLTGAGGGGCVLTVVPDQISEKTLLKVKSELKTEGYDCFEAAIGGPGVQVIFPGGTS